MLKERAFGLTGKQGAHGEDVKEFYFYPDATPSHSYLRYLYKYPQAEYPYRWLVDEAARRTRLDPDVNLFDAGLFQDNRYWDVEVRYAKAGPDEIHVRILASNRGPEEADLVVPQYLVLGRFRRQAQASRHREGGRSQVGGARGTFQPRYLLLVWTPGGGIVVYRERDQ
jgi:hypothetical protein